MRIEFGSPEWLAMLREAMRECVERAGTEARRTTFSMSERYTAPPVNLSADQSPIEFSVRFENGEMTFSDAFDEDADVTIEAPYAVVHPRARATFSEEPERWRKSFEELVENGTIILCGDWSRRPRWLDIHDEIALRTR